MHILNSKLQCKCHPASGGKEKKPCFLLVQVAEKLLQPLGPSSGIKGGGGHKGAFASPHWRLCPPPKKKNQPFSANFFDFCPLRNAFCPLSAPKNNFWCCHCWDLFSNGLQSVFEKVSVANLVSHRHDLTSLSPYKKCK